MLRLGRTWTRHRHSLRRRPATTPYHLASTATHGWAGFYTAESRLRWASDWLLTRPATARLRCHALSWRALVHVEHQISWRLSMLLKPARRAQEK
ncbi:uncharacterized protein MYCFIDRAFT_210964 [Pseudocercospora fijiensis CIRAD86]|uniref:Uncharacterized protein n=1 Tax=Pseudocercospora fijiensis (strain CIRAD86) TaxID=383855 RepID=M3AJJ4_PSEFD|nr:uncharacterized protein MYCFIDRAFT_210964 [Pseudocercospora fijiensis CIRAD86]EME84736.1 hypothetical protein MYCFIDRAFT_210964 [Pseudocercospora fijiensis CIRAD86]